MVGTGLGGGRGAEGPSFSPALVGLDLLLDVLPVGALGSLLCHGHQLDQLRPGVGPGTEQRGWDWLPGPIGSGPWGGSTGGAYPSQPTFRSSKKAAHTPPLGGLPTSTTVTYFSRALRM